MAKFTTKNTGLLTKPVPYVRKCMGELLQRIESALEEVVAPAPFGITGPIGVVVVAGLEETLRVGHEAHGTACGVHKAGNAQLRAVVVVGILQGNAAGVHVLLGIAGVTQGGLLRGQRAARTPRAGRWCRGNWGPPSPACPTCIQSARSCSR